MSNVQYSRTVKVYPLCLHLVTLIIQRIEKGKKIKLKTITSSAYITGRRWCPPLEITTLLNQKSKDMKE